MVGIPGSEFGLNDDALDDGDVLGTIVGFVLGAIKESDAILCSMIRIFSIFIPVPQRR